MIKLFGLKARGINRSERAFTLIEVMVALFIVATTLVAVLSSFSYHLGIFEDKKDEIKLILVAKENLYLYEKGKLSAMTGVKENINYVVTEEEFMLGIKKVISRASYGKNEVTLFSYVKKQ